jgi:hypothetical protein
MRMLPRTPEQQAIRVAVVGRIERIVAAGVLYLSEAERSTGYLRFAAPAAELASASIPAVLTSLAEEAAKAHAREVLLVGSIAEDHPLAARLLQNGFAPFRETEVYELDATAILRRVELIYQRLVGRGMIPPTVEAIAPRGPWLPKLREFLDGQEVTLAERLDTEEGFTIDHSLILIVDGAIRGAYFTRNRGRESYIGLILLDPALRGGLAWANTLMMRAMLCFGVSSGVERLIMEVHLDAHRGSREIALTSGAKFLCKRWQFRKQFLPDLH